ncbi:penicillin-binding protein [Microbispora hainanensis]|uniref:Penicillin-binding protein n=1 Tax=Microbispora hainanensis TaxID=568844 RepID=A0A544Z4P1_9ACTN|nr:penicillin-binding protein [Microbispora hainanensis]TQS24034.1 penicillin-binding protein [Microbispora hainanensis]
MKAFLISLCVAMLGAVVAVFLLLWNPAGGGADEKPVAAVSTSAGSASPAAGKSVLLNADGGVIEEFSGDCTQSGYPYLCRQVRERLLAEDPRLLTRGGLTIRTTIDQRLQRAAQQAVDAYVHRDDPQIATQVLIVPGEGTVRAMATSRDPDGERGLMQGTTAMPYALAAALAAGWRYDDGFFVGDAYRAPRFSTFKDCAGRPVGDPSHSIRNRKKGGARFVTLRAGTRDAVNTFFMQLQEKVGLCETVETARRLGLKSFDGKPLQEFETLPLGITQADPVSVATSYASLAARGRFCEPRVITEIRDGSGAVRPFPPNCTQVLDPAVADAVTGVLKDVLAESALKGIGREAAGMPGDGDTFRTAWYAGYTPGLASAVSLGDFSDPLRHPMVDVTIGSRRYAQVDGTSIPGLIWKKTMTEAVRGTQETRFTPPDTERFGGCRDSCPPP